MDYLMLKPLLVRLEEQFDMRRLGSLCMDSKGYSKVVRHSFVHGIQIGARFIDRWGYAIFDIFFFKNPITQTNFGKFISQHKFHCH